MKEKFIRKVLEISDNKLIENAVEFQKTLYSRIDFSKKIKNVNFVGGVDISYSNSDTGFCAIVVLRMKDFEIVDISTAKRIVFFPYIPGLLFYREFPVFYEAFKKLKQIPDLFMFDGHGLTHPRMMGIATMAGVVINIPTIGCAKSPLYGDYKEPGEEKFSFSPIRNQNKVVGYVLRSKEKCKPIFVSSGYRISPESALDITMSLIKAYKLPLPTYYAHKYATKFKNE